MQQMTQTDSPNVGSFIVDRKGTILGFDEGMEQLIGWRAMDVVGRVKSHTPRIGEADHGDAPLSHLPLYEGIIPMNPGNGRRPITFNTRDARQVQTETRCERIGGSGDRVLVRVLRVISTSGAAAAPRSSIDWDHLTGLPDAASFTRRMQSEMAVSVATGSPTALVLVDVDRLRLINDRLGRSAGDEVLRRIAGFLRVAIDEEARLARIGDDDFAVLLPNAGRADARQMAAGLRSTVERFRFFDPERLPGAPRVTISLGAASYPADAETAAELHERATEALEQARSMGRNRVWCYLRRPRVPLQVPVFFDGVEALLVGYARDLSPSGIFIQTSATIDIGMRCALAFPLPGHPGKVHVIGRVVRTVTPPDEPQHELQASGIAIEFERFGGSSDRRAVESFLHQHEALSLRPETGPLSL